MKINNLHRGNFRETHLNGFKNEKQLEKVAKDFEAILIGQFFRLMNKTISNEGVIKKSFERGIFEDMFHDELAKAYAKRGGLNLHRIIVDYFSGAKFSGRSGPIMPARKKVEVIDIRKIEKKNDKPLRLRNASAEARELKAKSRYMHIDVKNYKRDLLDKGE